MSEERKARTWWWFKGEYVAFFVGLDESRREVWKNRYSLEDNIDGEYPLYEIYDCTGFDHEFKIPDVPAEYANKWRHQTPAVFDVIGPDVDAWLSGSGSTVYDADAVVSTSCHPPKRWILEPVPVPAPKPAQIIIEMRLPDGRLLDKFVCQSGQGLDIQSDHINGHIHFSNIFEG